MPNMFLPYRKTVVNEVSHLSEKNFLACAGKIPESFRNKYSYPHLGKHKHPRIFERVLYSGTSGSYHGGIPPSERTDVAVDLSSYLTVAQRLAEFRAKYPEGSLQPVDELEPFTVTVIGDKTFISYAAAAYRTPDDARPGIGVAWEPFPGRTPYTRDSELMNAETSAWGRAIVAVLASDTTKGIATQEEIRNREEERKNAPAAQKPKTPVTANPQIAPNPEILAKGVITAKNLDELRGVWTELGNGGFLTTEVAHPETGEKVTFQQLLYERADVLGSPKSPQNGSGDTAASGDAAQKVASGRRTGK
jgi:hypothetical protein